MFGTIRYNKDTKDYEHLNLSTQPPGQDARGYTLVACDRCRTRKLKCTGEEEGCDRCRSAFTSCQYTMNTPNRTHQARPSKYRSSKSSETSIMNAQRPDHAASHLQSHTPEEPSTNQPCASVYPASSGVEVLPPAPENTLLSPETLLPQTPDATGNPTVCDLDTSPLCNFDAPGPLGLEDIIVPQLDAYLAGTADMELSGTDAKSLMIPSQPPMTDASFLVAGGSDTSANPVSAHIPTLRGLNRTLDCDCLPKLVELLERLGVQQVDRTGVDTHLLCLRSAVCICNKTISCSTCTACFDNPILLATIAQNLATIAEHVYHSCIHLRNHQPPSQTFGEKDILWGNGRIGEDLENAIWLGRYRVESPKLRNTLVCDASSVHLAELNRMLESLKSRLLPNRVAVAHVSQAAESVSRICLALHELLRCD
ncbi:hypothetical protein BDW42DRAFT_201160 [Aspergillus taichungensis]|uniref:Zn(2)-C6 fungal-type domain-containing protein n=1 Tax=Aspergillus taichungensis TaxID=482145 RepID=A0A2J5HTK6_9EURO|nr:hypothetical protein BDW42DRAFT_201160 [Aspergillus taichungensis]